MSKLGLRRTLGLNVFASLQKERVKRHELRTLFWESTLRCNLACRHCGSDCKASSVVPDMPLKDFLKVIDEQITPNVDTHKVMIVIAGGEVLLRKDLEEAGRELYKREYPWGIVTNGMLLDEKRLTSLLRAGLHSITVSIDGFAPSHNYIRRSEDSFNNAVRALRAIVKAPQLAYDVVTCVTQDNYDDLRRFRQFLIDEGCKAWRCFTVFPAGRGKEDERMQLSDEQFRGLMEFIKETRKEGKIHLSYGCEGFLGQYEGSVRDTFYNCSAGVSTAGIRIDGSISGCTSIRAHYDEGNIYRDNFWEVWSNGFERFRNREWMRKMSPCDKCKVWKYCLGNGMHLHEEDGTLMKCHYNKLVVND